MAGKSEMNLFERHAEKAVMAVCVILFIYVLWHWGLSSPNMMLVYTGKAADNEKLSPSQVDARLRESAAAIKKKMVDMPVGEVELPNYQNQLALFQQGLDLRRLGLSDVGSARAPEKGHGPGITIEPVGLKDLVPAILAPGAPLVIADRELPKTEQPTDVVVAHVASIYPQGDLLKSWGEKLKTTEIVPRAVVLGVIAEYQEMKPDGTWPNDNDVKVVRVASLPVAAAPGNPAAPPKIPAFDNKNSEAIAKVVKEYEDTWQWRIMEPDFWDIWWPGNPSTWVSWTVHLPRTVLSDRAEQANAAVINTTSGATGAPAAPPPVAPPPVVAPPVQAPPVPPPPTPPSPGPAPRGAIGPMGPGGPGPVGPPAVPQVRPVAPPAPAPAAGKVVASPAVGPAPVVVPVPTPQFQIQEGQYLVWFHDTSLISAKTYRYRLRLVLMNPAYGASEKNVQPKADAGVLEITTPPSEWSQAVSVPKPTQFFFYGESENLNTVNVMVFTFCMGQRVKKSFTVKPGQTIGGIEAVEVIDPLNPGKTIRVSADFNTGAVTVGFNFGVRILRAGGMAGATSEMLYLDEQGNLCSRISSIDVESERYKDLMREAKVTEASVKAAH